MKKIVYTRLELNDINRIDALIAKREFDNRSSFVRRAVIKYLDQLEPKILA